MIFTIDIFAWLPYNRVENLFWDLPDRARFGPAASGPYFLGDSFLVPPPWPDDVFQRTARAWQRLVLPVKRWGDDVPVRSGNVLTAPFHVLAEDGESRVHSDSGIVSRSVARVNYNPRSSWYEVEMIGDVTVPFLVAAARASAGLPAEEGPPDSHPVAGWHLQLYLQRGSTLPKQVSPLNLDASARCFGKTSALGGDGANRAHGNVRLRLFPSYVVYLSLQRPEGMFATPMLYFDGCGRNLLGILSQETTRLRTLTW